MVETEIKPRFSETDGLSHISNTVMPVWFEEARRPIFEKIHPSLKLEGWPFILAHMDVDYLQQVFITDPVMLKVGVSKIGGKSCTVYHEAWQKDRLVAKGSVVMVRFDFEKNSTVEIEEHFKEMLSEFLIENTGN